MAMVPKDSRWVGWELMASRGERGWTGEKSKRFMIVGTKDSVPVGAKSGVVAPVPINTPSLRQEIHGSHAENTGIPSITRSSAGGGWGTVAGASSSGNAADDTGASGKGRGRVGGDRSKGGDDVFTRHFPDLRAGLEQAEKLDAVTKASSKVAPLRKPKPEAAKDQGPSLRPRAMLKPTGSGGGGSVATAAAQAAIKDAVHNRVAEKPKPEEPRRNGPSFADEISSKSRWPGRSQLEGGQAEGGVGGRGGGGGGGRGAWDRNREGGRGRGGERGRGYDRERNSREGFQDKDRRNGGWGPDRSASNNRARESIYGSGGHAGMGATDNESASGTLKPTTTYVRQHGPPPRKTSSQGASAPSKAQVSPHQNDEQTPATHQPSTRSSGQSDADPWSATEATKWRTPLSADEPADTPEASSTPNVSPSQSGSYVRTHGPPRRGGREGADDDKGYSGSSSRPEGDHAAVRESDATGDVPARFSSGGGSSEHVRGGTERESFGNGERTLSGRWKEPAGGLAPPPAPTNTRWKEPKEDSFATRPGTRRWRNGSREESQMGSGRWSRDVGDVGDVGDAESSGGPSDPSPPVQNSSWTDSAGVGWGLQPGEEQEQTHVATDAPQEQLEQADGEPLTSETVTGAATAATSSEDNTVAIVDAAVEVKAPSTPASDENATTDSPAFQNSFVSHQTSTAQPVLRTASWEPQLPRGGDAWSAAGHGRDAQGDNQGQGQSGAPGATASQPWSDPWGTSSFGLPSTGGEQGSSAIASLLANNGPVEPRKDRYLPPALRNRTPSEGAQVEASSISTGDQETEATPAALQSDVGSTSLSNPELEMQSAGGRMGASNSAGTGAAKPPLYEQQQPPLEEWQHGRAQPSQLAPEDQSARPREQQLHQRQSQAQHPPQHLHMHDQPQHLKQEYQPPPPGGFSSFQQQDRRQAQMQEPVLRQFQPEHFRSPNYHAQDQGGRSTISEHVRRRQYPQEHLHRQQYNHVQMHQQQPPQQMHMPQHALQQHSLHQPQHPPQHMHAHQQGQHQPPAPLGNQMGQTHHTRQHPGHSQQQQQQQQQPPSQAQPHHQQEIGRQMSQPQQMLVQQPQQVQQHPPFMGYSDPRARGPGGLGGLPVHNMTQPASYRDMPLQQPGIPPPGTYDFQSPEAHHKR